MRELARVGCLALLEAELSSARLTPPSAHETTTKFAGTNRVVRGKIPSLQMGVGDLDRCAFPAPSWLWTPKQEQLVDTQWEAIMTNQCADKPHSDLSGLTVEKSKSPKSRQAAPTTAPAAVAAAHGAQAGGYLHFVL